MKRTQLFRIYTVKRYPCTFRMSGGNTRFVRWASHFQSEEGAPRVLVSFTFPTGEKYHSWHTLENAS